MGAREHGHLCKLVSNPARSRCVGVGASVCVWKGGGEGTEHIVLQALFLFKKSMHGTISSIHQLAATNPTAHRSHVSHASFCN